ncbi:MAG: tetratricopeptide repeat protein [Bacteroidota bacterium]
MTKRIIFNQESPQKNIKNHLQKYSGLFLLAFALITITGLSTNHYLQKKQNQENTKIIEDLAQIQYLMEQNKYSEAFSGQPGIYLGLEALSQKKIHDKRLASLINFYIAIIYKQKKNYQAALNHIQKVQFSSTTLQSRLKCLQGDIHCEIQNYHQALNSYLQATKLNPNKFTTPTYWFKAAHIYQKQKAYDKAIEAYQTIIDKYPTCRQYTQAQKHLERIKSLRKNQKNHQ